MSDADRATRERLLGEATRPFAESGFNKVTVREISASARAKVAAVSKPLGDKMALCSEVVVRFLAGVAGRHGQTSGGGEGVGGGGGGGGGSGEGVWRVRGAAGWG